MRHSLFLIRWKPVNNTFRKSIAQCFSDILFFRVFLFKIRPFHKQVMSRCRRQVAYNLFSIIWLFFSLFCYFFVSLDFRLFYVSFARCHLSSKLYLVSSILFFAFIFYPFSMILKYIAVNSTNFWSAIEEKFFKETENANQS